MYFYRPHKSERWSGHGCATGSDVRHKEETAEEILYTIHRRSICQRYLKNDDH